MPKTTSPAVALAIALTVSLGRADPNPPANLAPPDGAQEVSLTPTLSWSWEPPVGCPEGIGIVVFTVFLGTDAADLNEVGFCCNEGWPETVGPLEPDTEYFWRVRVVDEFWDCPGSHVAYSVIQSFATTAAVPARRATWGRIRQLYR